MVLLYAILSSELLERLMVGLRLTCILDAKMKSSFIIIQGIDNSPDWNQIANKWNSQREANLPLECEFETALS